MDIESIINSIWPDGSDICKRCNHKTKVMDFIWLGNNYVEYDKHCCPNCYDYLAANDKTLPARSI